MTEQPCTSERLHILLVSDWTLISVTSITANWDTASGRPPGHLHEMSAGLVSMMDADLFYNGIPRYFQHVLALFETAKAFSHTADFAHLALQALQPGQKEPAFAFKSEILSRLFTAELKCSRFLAAFTALAQFTDHALQKSAMIALIDAGLQVIETLPIGLHPQLSRHVDQHLAALAKKQKSIPGVQSQLWTSHNDVDYLTILHAFRIAQKDYRGAVTVLLDRLKLIKRSNQARNDPEAVQLRRALLVLINALSCVAPDEAYLLTEENESPKTNGMVAGNFGGAADPNGGSTRRRIIITLNDLRREYQQLLDKCSRIERGDFDFEMDEHGSDEDEETSQGVNGIGNGDAMQV